MKRWPGESFEDYRARRSESNAVCNAHMKGRLASGRYVDPALHSVMLEETNLARAKRMAYAVFLCVLSGAFGYGLGTLMWNL